MKILIAGSSGLVGQALIKHFEGRGDEVYRLVRSNGQKKGILWDPAHGKINPGQIEGFDAVINLAGENIASYWTKAKKKKILESRVKSTETLSRCLAELKNPPKVFINASATGFYGNSGDEIVSESSPNGSGFLSQVCKEWEAAAKPAVDRGIRTVFLRTGIVLSPHGGALSKMLIPFRLGLGGVVGPGKQYMSWIALDELVHVIAFIVDNDAVVGPVNAVSPHPVTNREFTKTLGGVLHRPTIFPLPSLIAHFVAGEMADEMLLSSTRAEPKVLLSAGYKYRYPQLGPTLKELLG